MADNRAALITDIQNAARDAVGTDDDFLSFATAVANAIGVWGLALKATGLDSNGDTHDLDIG